MRGLDDLALDRPGAVVVALGAHADDVEIGAGGTLLRLVGDNPGLRVVWFVGSADGVRRAEAEEAAAAFAGPAQVHLVVGDLPDGMFPARWARVKEALLEVCEIAPDPALVLAPHRDDRHQDHAAVGQIAWQLWRSSTIAAYEVPKYESEVAAPNLFVPLPTDIARRKVALLDRLHRSQHARPWWDPALFEGHLRRRGIEARSAYAEGFVAEKLLLYPSDW